MQEIVALISGQGIGLIIAALVIFALMKGVPKFFSWLAAQWEELKNAFKNYMGEQIDTMKELAQSNRELVSTVFTMNSKVDSIEDRVEIISEDIKVIKEKVSK